MAAYRPRTSAARPRSHLRPTLCGSGPSDTSANIRPATLKTPHYRAGSPLLILAWRRMPPSPGRAANQSPSPDPCPASGPMTRIQAEADGALQEQCYPDASPALLARRQRHSTLLEPRAAKRTELEKCARKLTALCGLGVGLLTARGLT